MATNTKNSASASATKTETSSLTGIEKTVQENTPSFVSKYFNIVVENLESFRINTFNSQFIFYPILFVFIFFLGRHVWRKFF